MESQETRNIPLPQGGTLQVAMSERFVSAVRDHFGIKDDVPLSDDHVRTYIFRAVKNAIDSHELKQEMSFESDSVVVNKVEIF